VVITRHERPVARLVPEGRRKLESVRAAVAGMFELRGQIVAGNRGRPKLTAAEVKSWIGEGRRCGVEREFHRGCVRRICVDPSGSGPAGNRPLLIEVAAGATVAVPSLCHLEMANVLLIAERRHRVTAVQHKTALEKLTATQFTVEEEGSRHAFGKTCELAEKHGLTICDAIHLELALRRSLPLASRDEALKIAAKRRGLKTIQIRAVLTWLPKSMSTPAA
jgi:predicted nucleic acid-binding protein